MPSTSQPNSELPTSELPISELECVTAVNAAARNVARRVAAKSPMRLVDQQHRSRAFRSAVCRHAAQQDVLQRCLAVVVQHKHRRLQLFGPLAERLRTALLNAFCTPGYLPDTRPLYLAWYAKKH